MIYTYLIKIFFEPIGVNIFNKVRFYSINYILRGRNKL